ncbi:MAG: hypothetical protein M3066_03925 [Actinomycetota bacterium]|nr:hypothetical protein [Actinomycetota bacterium]
MTFFRRRTVPGTAIGGFEVAGFRHLAAVEVPEVVQVRPQEGDGDFRAHDEVAELLLAEKDVHLLRARELRRSRRLRSRRKGLEAQVAAAAALTARRDQDLAEANALLREARLALAPIAFRRLSHAGYLRRKIVFAAGESISLAVAFSAAFDVPPLEGLLLSAGIALAFVVAGDLGGVLRHAVDGARLSDTELDPRFRHLALTGGRRWLVAAWCAAAALFVLAGAAVGALRAGGGAGVPLAAAMAVLTLVLAVGSGISSWQHANLPSDLLDHLERAEHRAATAWARAASAPVIARYDALGERIDVRRRAAEERGEARLRLADALCAFFRARHPQLFGHGVRSRQAQSNGTAPVAVPRRASTNSTATRRVS